MVPGRSAAAMTGWLAERSPEFRATVEIVAMDGFGGSKTARTHVLLLVHDRDIRVVNATTGELLHELVLDPTRDYQPHIRRPHPEQAETPNP